MDELRGMHGVHFLRHLSTYIHIYMRIHCVFLFHMEHITPHIYTRCACRDENQLRGRKEVSFRDRRIGNGRERAKQSNIRRHEYQASKENSGKPENNVQIQTRAFSFFTSLPSVRIQTSGKSAHTHAPDRLICCISLRGSGKATTVL